MPIVDSILSRVFIAAWLCASAVEADQYLGRLVVLTDVGEHAGEILGLLGLGQRLDAGVVERLTVGPGRSRHGDDPADRGGGRADRVQLFHQRLVELAIAQKDGSGGSYDDDGRVCSCASEVVRDDRQTVIAREIGEELQYVSAAGGRERYVEGATREGSHYHDHRHLPLQGPLAQPGQAHVLVALDVLLDLQSGPEDPVLQQELERRQEGQRGGDQDRDGDRYRGANAAEEGHVGDGHDYVSHNDRDPCGEYGLSRPVHRGGDALLGRAALHPFLPGPPELQDRVVHGEAQHEEDRQRGGEEGEGPVPHVDDAEVDHGKCDPQSYSSDQNRDYRGERAEEQDADDRERRQHARNHGDLDHGPEDLRDVGGEYRPARHIVGAERRDARAGHVALEGRNHAVGRRDGEVVDDYHGPVVRADEVLRQ